MRHVFAILLVAVLAIPAAALAVALEAGGGAYSAPPALRIVDRSPLTVAGTHFRARERVRLDVMAPAADRAAVVANAQGGLRAGFDDVRASRCDRVVVKAVGSGGSRVVLKILPGPACLLA